MPVTQRDLIVDALTDIGVVSSTMAVADADVALGLSRLRRLYDQWNADDVACYASQFQTFTLSPGVNPTTLGPSGATWTTSIRPDTIQNATLIVAGIRYPIVLHDALWWANVTWPTQQTAWPTDGYYNPTWPNGSLYLWTVPSSAYDVQLTSQVRLTSEVALTDSVSLPPGYRDAITKTLAESLVGPFRVPMPEGLPSQAAQARATVVRNNQPTPPLMTCDTGLPGGRGGWFNYRSGLVQR